MQKVAEEIYADVVKYFAKEEIQQIIKNLSDYLVEYEVIYDFDLAYEQAKNNEPIVLEKHSLTDVDKANEIALEKKEVEDNA